jgi:hypothetical protein
LLPACRKKLYITLITVEKQTAKKFLILKRPKFQLESEANELSGQVMKALEDRRRDCADNAEEIRQLHERVKYNYERLDPLTELPLKVKDQRGPKDLKTFR